MTFRIVSRMLAAGALALPCVSMAQTQERAAGMAEPADRKDDERQRTFVFDIPAQAMAQAVLAFARQAGVDLYMNDVDLSAYTSVALKGSFSIETGLTRLLGNSPIGYRYRRTAGAVRPNVQLVDNGPGARARVYSMAPVVVRGNDVNERVYQAPRAVSIVTREEMDRVPVRHAAELIQDTPGVASAVNRQNPGLSINIRGMQDFGRVNMMIDGMRQDFVQNGHMQRNGEMYVDSELLSEAVVERGVVHGVHGTGAMAGSVDFRTLDFGDVLREGREIGLKLRGTSGMGYQGNGVNFIGSAAGAARAGENLEVMAAVSRRSIGDYRIGARGGIEGQNSVWFNGGKIEFNDVKFAAQEQDSGLFKARWKLSDDQSLLFSYVGTRVGYSYTTDADTSAQESGTPWRKMGTSKAQSNSFALDYKIKPADNPLLDLKVKAYGVETNVENYTTPTYPFSRFDGEFTDAAKIRENIDNEYWDSGACEKPDKTPYALDVCRQYGVGRNNRLSTKTQGFQLDNTSRFVFGATTLSANYGVEYFTDHTTSNQRWNHDGREVRPIGTTGKDALNPQGRRSMGSIFTELKLEDDFFTISASLRYERYRLKGKTQVPGKQTVHLSRLDKFAKEMCAYGAFPGLAPNENPRSQVQSVYGPGCRLALAGDEAAIAAWWADVPTYVDQRGRTRNFYIPGGRRSSDYEKEWQPEDLDDQNALYDYDVSRSAGMLLPALSGAIRPTNWLEVYGSWGKSWRPPAINEMLMVGNHPRDGFASIYPNPNAEPETSRTWEVGANTIFQDVALDGDSLSLKAGYFDTRADNYLFSSMDVILPGSNLERLPLPGTTAFVNNRNRTKFRGLEFEGRYEAGWIYGGASYTHYLGGPNKFCEDLYFLGSGENKFDRPNADGSYPVEHQKALARGYESWRAWADDQVVCDNFVFNSAIAKPVDKGTLMVGVRLLERKLDTGVRFNYSGEGWYNRDSGGSQVWFKYTTWDWYASYQANDNVKLMASVENITNRMYVDGYSDAMARTFAPGRSVALGMEVRF